MDTNEAKAGTAAVIAWNKKISLLTNSLVMRDLVLVLGIACGAVGIFMLLISGGEYLDQVILMWLACSAIVGGLLVIACLIVFFNRMDMEFGVGPEGVMTAVGKREQKIDRAVAIIGILAGSPQVAGAGLLAESNEMVMAPWRDVKKVTIYRRQKVIALRVGMLTPLRLYCMDENFAAVERMIKEKAKKATFVEK